MASLRLEAEQVRAELGAAIRRFAVRVLAEQLIAQTLEVYERTHVPEVLRSAGRRLEAVTASRYVAVRAPEDGRLQVEAADGALLDAAELSQGTREQLYLVVRLGLVDSFARQAESLPLVLDDILVNADPERRAGLVLVLAEAARDHQTLLLTCHPEVVAAVRAAVPGAQHVRLPRLPAPGSVPGPAEVAAAAEAEPDGGEAGAGDPAERILRALGAAGAPLGRRDLLAASGVAEGDWNAAIGALLAAGRVVARGKGRGRVYAPAG